MNEKIRELSETCYTTKYNPFGADEEKYDMEKFAELIIKECFKIVDDYGIEQAGIAEENYCGEQLYVSMKITDSAYKIKEHFGIE